MEFLNIIIENGNINERDESLLFGKVCHTKGCLGCSDCCDEEVVRLPPETNMYDVLVMIGAFGGRKTQIRKNWKQGKTIPTGWSEFKIGKYPRRHLCIWNPTE